MWFAVKELFQTLQAAWRAAWRAADLSRRLECWWYVVTHRRLLNGESRKDREVANA